MKENKQYFVVVKHSGEEYILKEEFSIYANKYYFRTYPLKSQLNNKHCTYRLSLDDANKTLKKLHRYKKQAGWYSGCEFYLRRVSKCTK